MLQFTAVILIEAKSQFQRAFSHCFLLNNYKTFLFESFSVSEIKNIVHDDDEDDDDELLHFAKRICFAKFQLLSNLSQAALINVHLGNSLNEERM